MDIKANLFELLKVILLGVINVGVVYASIYLNKLKDKAISEINKNFFRLNENFGHSQSYI